MSTDNPFLTISPPDSLPEYTRWLYQLHRILGTEYPDRNTDELERLSIVLGQLVQKLPGTPKELTMGDVMDACYQGRITIEMIQQALAEPEPKHSDFSIKLWLHFTTDKLSEAAKRQMLWAACAHILGKPATTLDEDAVADLLSHPEIQRLQVKIKSPTW